MRSGGRVLFLTISGSNGASSRYRVFQYLPALEEAGFRVDVAPKSENKNAGIGRLLHGMIEERGCLSLARDADIVFIQKRLFGQAFLTRLKALGKRIIFDFDDSIFTSPGGTWSGPTRRKVRGRLEKVFEVSDTVIAGNAYLRDYALGAGAKEVEVLPTAIPLRRYGVKQHSDRGPLVLGWIGSSVNHMYVDMLAGVLPDVVRDFPGMRLRVVSDRDYKMAGVEVENRRWSEETEVDDLLGMDIGLMPLMDNEWTRGKCALKALQYMACGIPAVCSPVGANLEAVRDGVEGRLPDGPGEWASAIRELASSAATRAAMGKAGKEKVREAFSLDAVAPKLVHILKSVAQDL